MVENEALEASVLRTWIGRTERATDIVTPRLVQGLFATMDQDSPLPVEGQAAPAGVHWCLAPPAVPSSRIGPDGHPSRGDFLPPVPLPRRMWAGGSITFRDRLRVGDAVERASQVVDVVIKEGRSGALCFVTVEHQICTERGVAALERQDIVYRGMDRERAATAAPPANTHPVHWQRIVQADPVLLFRYSALTFNGHRIHYDRAYCTEVEDYPGLVVHGPLQATLLLELAASSRDGRAPLTFEFRGVRPLFDGAAFSLNAIGTDGGLDLWVADHEGHTTMIAKAGW